MSASTTGLRDWSLSRDDQGYREYKTTWLVKTTDYNDGPLTALLASGLPTIGSAFALGNDVDPWVFCLPKADVRRHNARPGEKHKWWEVDIFFSSPKPSGIRCQNTNIDDPMSEPPKISGSFVKYTREAQVRSDGTAILSSCHQPITGIEKDSTRWSVNIEMNSLTNDLGLYNNLADCLNDSLLWGVPARHVKFSEFGFEKRYYGSCYAYYTHRLGFEIRREGFDLDDVVDTGVLEFDPDKVGGADDTPTNRSNPEFFTVIKDAKGENVTNPVALDGNGSRVTNPQIAANIVYLPTIDLYPQANLYLLGIPAFL